MESLNVETLAVIKPFTYLIQTLLTSIYLLLHVRCLIISINNYYNSHNKYV